jgi:hypothetical protein
MTFRYSTEVSNLIDYELMMSNYEIEGTNKYTVDVGYDNKLYDLIYDYVYIIEHKNIIKKIVYTYGMFNAIKLYLDNNGKEYKIDNELLIMRDEYKTYCKLCIPIVLNNLKYLWDEHRDEIITLNLVINYRYNISPTCEIMTY